MNKKLIILCAAIATLPLAVFELVVDDIPFSSNDMLGMMLFCTGLILACMSLSVSEAPK